MTICRKIQNPARRRLPPGRPLSGQELLRGALAPVRERNSRLTAESIELMAAGDNLKVAKTGKAPYNGIWRKTPIHLD